MSQWLNQSVSANIVIQWISSYQPSYSSVGPCLTCDGVNSGGLTMSYGCFEYVKFQCFHGFLCCAAFKYSDNIVHTDSRYNVHTFTMGLISCQKWLAWASGQQDYMWWKKNGRKADFWSSKHSKWTQKFLGFFINALQNKFKKNSTLALSQKNDIGASTEQFYLTKPWR